MKFTNLTIKVILIASLLISPVYSLSANANTEAVATGETEYTTKLAIEINNIRLEQGLNGLATSSELMQAAQMKAEDMAAKGYFAHTSPEGISPWHWFYEAGYKPRLAGENLALSYSLESDIVTAWLNSPGHKRNIVKENYTETGFGVAVGTYNGQAVYYIVELFGHR